MNFFMPNNKTFLQGRFDVFQIPKMHFHQSPLQCLLQKQTFPFNNAKKFSNPNYVNQNPSINQIINEPSADPEPDENSSCIEEPIVTKRETKPMTKPSRKRDRRNLRSRTKSMEKHNQNRLLINEIMSMNIDSESTCDEEETQEVPMSSGSVDIPFNICMEAPGGCISFSISPPTMRSRQLSTTESEDSFIIFDSGTEEECEFSENDDSSGESEDETDADSPFTIIPAKKVRFAKDLCEVHPMVQWSFAYKAARKGPWEVYARDRDRFKNRIRCLGNKLNEILKPEHRRKIYEQRFKDDT